MGPKSNGRSLGLAQYVVIVAIAVLVLILWPQGATAFTRADSMSVVAVLDSLPAEERLSYLHDTIRRVGYDDPEQALGIGKIALEEAHRQQDPAAINVAFMDIGLAHYFLGDYRNALRNYQEGLAIARDLNNKAKMAIANNNIGVLYFVWGEHDTALEHYLLTLDLYLGTGNPTGAANCYNNIAGIHQTAGRYDLALEQYQRALEIFLELDKQTYATSTMNNIGLIHFEQGQYEQALGVMQEALDIGRAAGDLLGQAQSLNNMGMVHLELRHIDQARTLFTEALGIHRSRTDRQGESVSLQYLGTVLVKDGDPIGGITMLEDALEIAQDLEVQELIRNDLAALAEAWEAAGRYDLALDYYRRYKKAHDQIFDEARTRQMAAAEARYESDIKDKEIGNLRQEAEFEAFRRRIMLASAVFLLMIVILIWSRYRFQKKANSVISTKNEVLAQAHAKLEKVAREEMAHVTRVATMGELTAAFAHELHQPLTAIKTNARAGRNLLQRPTAAVDEVHEALQDISEDAERAREIISRLREMMLKGVERRDYHDINTIVRSGLSFIESVARNHGVTIRLELAPGLPQIDCDHIQLQQVILNLLQNGLAAMENQGGEIVIETASSDDGDIIVRVRDEGPEVSAEVLSEMFDPFFTTKSAGLGMGLPICRTIIEAHGGKLQASGNEEGGLTVYFNVPCVL